MRLFLHHALVDTRNGVEKLRTSASERSSEESSFELPPKILQLNVESKSGPALLTFHSEEIARQLTLLEHRRLQTLDLTELVACKWTKPGNQAPTLNRVAKALDRLTGWFAQQVVQESDLRLRVRVLAQLIDIGHHLLAFRNFNTLLGIFLALFLPSISRLTNTWRVRLPSLVPLLPRFRSLDLESFSGVNDQVGTDSVRDDAIWKLCELSRVSSHPGSTNHLVSRSLLEGSALPKPET